MIIRRLRCRICDKIHHELPDILVPYKRYDSESIEAVLSGGTGLSVAADESTLSRWKQWFAGLVNYFLGCLLSIAVLYMEKSAEERSDLPRSSL